MAVEERATSVLINQLGMLYYEHGNYTSAEPLLTEALSGTRSGRQLGDAHPCTVISVGHVALLYSVQGKYAQA